ncbi:Pyrrolo-quinoline quinone [Candidatus Koribacter versatilis Ellin345]|uniref:Pyrrolo-quinoline quinone n=1 Tax=Koribacter versatilis (strain Ellin345) TaxID=204669 RepID=Q1IIY3_KORVE|nr:PQQ-binding-like beta-propeller repeat protein [Candidatus Koribacter versatilis]ABF43167.1 Pyrrolo-quinoline quinone [Candidatus Koribacter versatilis Ellin345]
MLKSAVAVLLFSTIAVAQDAAMFRGNPEHTGVYNAAGAPQFHSLKWKFETKAQLHSSPAVANGVVYVGSTSRNLLAVDLETGKLKWKFETGARIVSSPAVVDGVVYVASYDGNFYAVDAVTGKEKWKFKTGGEKRFAAPHLHGSTPVTETMPDPFDSYLSSPVVVAGVVYFGSGDTNVYALNAADGSLKWKFKTGDVVHASPALADGTLYVGSWDSYFYAIDAATGKEKWKLKTGEDHDIYNQVGIQSSAAVADGVVYFGCRDSNFYAVDAKTGEKKWAFNNKGSWVISSPAVKDGRVYFATSDTGLVYALDLNGKEVWHFDGKHWVVFSSPAIAGNTLYLGSHAGKLRAIDLTSGKLAWEFETDGSKANGAGLTKPDGTPNYEAAFHTNFYDDMVAGVQIMLKTGAILGSPVVSGDTVIFASSDGNVYAVR